LLGATGRRVSINKVPEEERDTNTGLSARRRKGGKSEGRDVNDREVRSTLRKDTPGGGWNSMNRIPIKKKKKNPPRRWTGPSVKKKRGAM